MKKFLLLILFQLFVFSILCQRPEINFVHLSVQQGLADHEINCIMQDHNGFIWIGGIHGLYKHNGYDFLFFKNPPGCRNCPSFNSVHVIIEDHLGLLWIFSEDEITLFDPEKDKSMTVYHLKYDPTYEGSEVDYTMLLDSRGNIWASYQKGLIKISYQADIKIPVMRETIFNHAAQDIFKIDTVQHSSYKNRPENGVLSLNLDEQGNIWAGCAEGLYVLRQGDRTFVSLNKGVNKGIQQTIQDVRAVVQIDEDSYWVAARNDLYMLTNVKGALHDSFPEKSLHFVSLKSVLEGHHIYSLTLDRNKNSLLGADEEIYLIKRGVKTGEVTFEQVSHSQTESEWAGYGNRVQAIFEDRTGIHWAAQSYYGVSKFNMIQSQFRLYKDLISKNFKSTDIGPIFKDNAGNLWIGTNGGGLYKIQPEINKVTQYDPGPQKNSILCLQELSSGLFWLGLSEGILEFDSNSGKFRDPLPATGIAKNLRGAMIWDFLKDGNQLYIATSFGLFVYNYLNKEVYQYSFTSKLDPVNTVMTLIKMRDGEIWAGTFWFGINKIDFNSHNGSLSLKTVFTNKVLYDTGIDIASMYRLYEDSKGLLWIANYSGIHRVNIKTSQIKNYDLFENTKFPEVRSITEDDHNNLWLGTHSGLCRFNMETGKVKVYEKYDGVPILVHGQNSVFKDNGGRMYFGGLGGFYSFHPDSMKINDSIPPIVITDFRLFNKSVKADTTNRSILTKNISYTRSIELKYNQNDLSFTFSALDYTNPSKNQYAYRLEGYQDEWIQTDANNRVATFTNLDPGNYTFRVKGSNNDDIWNEEGTFINILIHPPFWRTKLAFIIYIVLFLILLRGYIYWRTKQLRKEKIVLEKLVNERTDELLHQKEELLSTLENLQKTQEQLIESEKMAALGGLVAGVAHEINTPVGIGITAASSLHEDIQKMAGLYKNDEISRKDFKEFLDAVNYAAILILKNLERTASLIQSFKQVSADQISEQQRIFNLKSYLDDIISSLSPKFRQKEITFNVVCDERLEVNSFPGAFAQIFTNLLMNSMTHGFNKKQKGTITIQVTRKDTVLALEYSDDGAGISKKDLPHIFEPFFTTDQGRGTGLGLNILYNIIKQKLQGSVSCISTPGEGARFIMEIPVIFNIQTHGKEL
jgi:signal transduction histidine kinase/ligand-binding sensor domain-containing protein